MNKSVFVGSALEMGAQFAPVFDDGDAAVLVIAETGKGKTLPVLTANLIQTPASVFFVDFDGQMTRQIGPWRETMLGQELTVFDPTKMVEDRYLPKRRAQQGNHLDYTGRESVPLVPYRGGLNPIDYIAKSKAPELAARVVSSSVFPTNTLEESHWGKQAQNHGSARLRFSAFDPIFDCLTSLDHSIKRTMSSLYRLTTSESGEKLLLEAMAESDDPFIADHANAFLSASDDNREMQGIRNQMRGGLADLFSVPGVAEMLDETTVDFAAMRNRPHTVSLVLPGVYMQPLASLVRLLSAIMQAEIETAGVLEYGANCLPTLFFIDESWMLGQFDPLLHCMAFMRKFGCRVVLAAQNLSQIKEAWGKKFESLMGNVGCIEFFGGTSDLFTAKYISEICGMETIPGPSVSTSGKPGEFGSESQNTLGRRVHMPDEVMRLSMPQAIIKKSGYQPSKCRVISPSLSDFPEFCAFRKAIEEGRTREQAKRAAESIRAMRPAPLSRPVLKAQPQQQKKRRSRSQWGFFDGLLGSFMGHEKE